MLVACDGHCIACAWEQALLLGRVLATVLGTASASHVASAPPSIIEQAVVTLVAIVVSRCTLWFS